jgi:hypothetical protein
MFSEIGSQENVEGVWGDLLQKVSPKNISSRREKDGDRR